jgi:queuine tRNA-ribosyltransferase
MCGHVCDILPTSKPRYLMGVGTPVNILQGIALGVDMFDCVMPTRNGRNGMLFTTQGIINIKNKKWETDFTPLDTGFTNTVSNTYTKAYVRHLFAANEILGLQIASTHNLAFYLHLVTQAREHILNNTFSTWQPQMIKQVSQRL